MYIFRVDCGQKSNAGSQGMEVKLVGRRLQLGPVVVKDFCPGGGVEKIVHRVHEDGRCEGSKKTCSDAPCLSLCSVRAMGYQLPPRRRRCAVKAASASSWSWRGRVDGGFVVSKNSRSAKKVTSRRLGIAYGNRLLTICPFGKARAGPAHL